MSKILEAMRRSSPETEIDFGFKLATIDGTNLFPAPPPDQMPEFDRLANALLSLLNGAPGQAATFASTTSGEGASYVSYNLARHLSFLLDRKVAWVDANFRSPQMRLTGSPSFRALLQNPSLFSELKTAGNLVLVPNGDEPIKPTDLLTSENYQMILEQFQRTFYFTVIDGPPILDSLDTAHLAAPTLGLVLVIEARRLKYEVIRHGMETVGAHRVKILGSVLNKRTFDIPGFLYKKL